MHTRTRYTLRGILGWVNVPSSTTQLVYRIGHQRAAAAAVMTSLGGTSSACAMGRNGQSFPAYKYHEGKAAALGKLGRHLRSSDDRDAHGIVATAVQDWRQEVARRTGSARDWEAYAAGGLDAAQTVAGWLEAE